LDCWWGSFRNHLVWAVWQMNWYTVGHTVQLRVPSQIAQKLDTRRPFLSAAHQLAPGVRLLAEGSERKLHVAATRLRANGSRGWGEALTRPAVAWPGTSGAASWSGTWAASRDRGRGRAGARPGASRRRRSRTGSAARPARPWAAACASSSWVRFAPGRHGSPAPRAAWARWRTDAQTEHWLTCRTTRIRVALSRDTSPALPSCPLGRRSWSMFRRLSEDWSRKLDQTTTCYLGFQPMLFKRDTLHAYQLLGWPSTSISRWIHVSKCVQELNAFGHIAKDRWYIHFSCNLFQINTRILIHYNVAAFWSDDDVTR